MKVSNTSARLKELMKERNLRQVDILTLSKPFCDRFDIKLNKNDLSQYLSGKVEPGQNKLLILSMSLNVSEAWIMGYDVPKEREDGSDSGIHIAGGFFFGQLGKIIDLFTNVLDEEDKERLTQFAIFLSQSKNKNL